MATSVVNLEQGFKVIDNLLNILYTADCLGEPSSEMLLERSVDTAAYAQANIERETQVAWAPEHLRQMARGVIESLSGGVNGRPNQ